MEIVKKTLIFSLYAQIITTIAGIYGIFIKIPNEDKILNEIITLETVVQIIEFTFYIWFSFFYNKNVDKEDIAKYRYYDWIFTTPIMLFNTVAFFEYNNLKKEGKTIDFKEFVMTNKENLIKIFVFNFLMLLMGYLHEIGLLHIGISNTIGFIFFGLSFYVIYEYAVKSVENMNIFYILTILWGMYGIAAMFPKNIKNAFYNILDIFSKNFYGLFIVYIIWTLRIN